MIVIACGGRAYEDEKNVMFYLDFVHSMKRITELRHGGANGADRFAAIWAQENDIRCVMYKADWAKYGKRAGPLRNTQMFLNSVGEEPAELVIAFPGGDGTADMVRQAKANGVKVIEVDGPKQDEWGALGINLGIRPLIQKEAFE